MKINHRYIRLANKQTNIALLFLNKLVQVLLVLENQWRSIIMPDPSQQIFDSCIERINSVIGQAIDNIIFTENNECASIQDKKDGEMTDELTKTEK
jgi:hypothetical protein